MRRLTMWITATLAVVALVIAYQLNATGVGAKGGNEGDHGGSPPQPCATAPANSTAAPSTCPSGAPTPTGSAGSSTSPTPSGPAGSASAGKDDDRGTNDQDGKPGENK